MVGIEEGGSMLKGIPSELRRSTEPEVEEEALAPCCRDSVSLGALSCDTESGTHLANSHAGHTGRYHGGGS